MELGLLQLLQQQEEAQKQQYDSALRAANEPASLTSQEQYGGAALGLLPLLIGGLIKGREGLNIGAQAGMLGLGQYGKNLEGEAEKRQKTSQLEAKSALDGLDQTRKQKFQLQMEDVKQENRKDFRREFPDKGIKIEMPGAPIDHKVYMDLVQPQLVVSRAIQNSIDSIVKLVPDYNAQRYVDRDGNIDFEGIKRLLADKSLATVMGANSNVGQVEASVNRTIQDLLLAYSGKSSTDQEFSRRLEGIKGAGLTPVTLPKLIEIFKDIQNDQKNIAATNLEGFNEFTRGGSGREVVDRMFRFAGSSQPPVPPALERVDQNQFDLLTQVPGARRVK